MKKIIINKTLIVIMLLTLAILTAFGVIALDLEPCKNNKDYFKDKSGNGYCIAEEIVLNSATDSLFGIKADNT